MDFKDKYLARIGHSFPVENDENGLFGLHRSHAFSIPFENISVLVGDPVNLEPESLADKILQQKRGGYCFELNGLFAYAMREFGFDYQVHLARVQVHMPEPGPLTHQIGICRTGSREWLCDVGFGGPSIRYPMPLELDRVEIQDGEAFRLVRNADFGWGLQQKQPDDSWFPLYFFQTNRIQSADIAMANYFTSTWEHSIFRQGPLCAKAFPGGKNTLMGRELKMREGALLQTKKIETGEEFLQLLGEKFCIELSAESSVKAIAAFDRLP